MNNEIFITKEIIDKISKIFNIRKEELIERYKINSNDYLPIYTIIKLDKNIKIPILKKIHNRQNIKKKIESKIVLRDEQIIIFNKLIDVIKTKKDEIISILFIAPCGFGKTFISLSLLEKIVFNKTIIITHSRSMAEQWAESIQKSYDNLNVYISNLGVAQFKYNDDIDILCFPPMHLKEMKFIDFVRKNFSICIIDEIHKYNLLNNSIISNFLSKYIFPISLYITATPRKDTKLYISDIIDATEYHKTTFEKQYFVISSNERIKEFEYFKEFKKFNKIKHDPIKYDLNLKLCLSADFNRHALICKWIRTEYKTYPNSKILLLTKFNNEIDIYYKLLSDLNTFYIKATETSLKDKLKEIDDTNLERYILIGTGDNIGTGSDTNQFTSLHHSILYININNIKQSIGRISRENVEKIRRIFIYNIKPHNDIRIEKYISTTISVLEELGWTNYIENKIKPYIDKDYTKVINSNIYKNYNKFDKLIIENLKNDNFFDTGFIDSNICFHNL